MSGNKRPRTQSLTLNQAAPKRAKKQQSTFPFLSSEEHKPCPPALPPLRIHTSRYHRPALLDHVPSQTALLGWFDSVSKDRDMPWRQKWIDPVAFEQTADQDDDLRETLKKRAYQVWISEIMLQQTRVETVRAYYQAWHSRWPTIEDLAGAEPPEVLSAWKGLGYYSRATRIHTAAKLIVDDKMMKGLLPELPAELEAKIPGVGRYTAGAISSIVFGHAVPILDGNVMRVLCRQMGLYANMKSKSTTDLLWEAADKLVKGITKIALVEKGVEVEEDEIPKSEIPSFWNQALMELGSTLCKPVKPDCGNCPIKETCLAFAEGEVLAQNQGLLDTKKSHTIFGTLSNSEMPDIEDLCSYCEPMEETETMNQPDVTPKPVTKGKAKPGLKQGTLSFGQKSKSVPQMKQPEDDSSTKAAAVIDKHASLFPLKVIKKAVRNEECVVCVIKRTAPNGKQEWLIEQRPDKGLLASLWQFPSLTIFTADGKANASEEDSEAEDDSEDDMPLNSRKKKSKAKPKVASTPRTTVQPPTAKQRKQSAIAFVNAVTQQSYDSTLKTTGGVRYICEAGSITHLFSHIKLVMHVHLFSLDKAPLDTEGIAKKNGTKQAEYQQRKWASQKEVEEESFGTGMRKCWMLALKEECEL